jgi:hypothetical protein
MSRKIALSACALALVGTFQCAYAVSLNPRGIGEALIYPYYTINKGQNTLISVVNPTELGKAIQVRFREGHNGRDTLSFVLYLAPHDIWTASMSESHFGGATLKTSDKSCTSPATFPNDGAQLSSAGYDGSFATYPADGGPQDISRTREGSIELIIGADVAPGSATAAAIAHPRSGTPTCNALASLNFGDLRPPTGGIYGSASIVDVGQGTFFAYNADALQGFTGVQLFSAGSPLGPTLADANSPESQVGGAVAYVTTQNGKSLAIDYANGVDAVSATLMADTIYGEYLVDGGLGANTDWIATFPTKSYYVDKGLYPGPMALFESAFEPPGLSSVTLSGTVCDREQACDMFEGLLGLSYEVNTIAVRAGGYPFIGPSGVFASNQLSLTIPPQHEAGMIAVNLSSGDMQHSLHVLSGGRDADGNPVSLHGLPITGFVAYDIVNTNVQQSVLANYSGVFPFRETLGCDGPIDDCQ